MDKIYSFLTCDMQLQKGITISEINRLEVTLDLKLPQDYKAFLQFSDGAVGSIGPNHFLQLWSIDELIQNNYGYCFVENNPGIFLFGSNGSSEGYGFDTLVQPYVIIQIPFLSLYREDIIAISKSFLGFLYFLKTGEKKEM